MSTQGRGRARGRARGQESTMPAGGAPTMRRPGPTPTPGVGPAPVKPPTSAWGPPTAAAPAAGRAVHRGPDPKPAGAAELVPGIQQMDIRGGGSAHMASSQMYGGNGNGNGNGNGSGPVGRGGVRGKRQIAPEIVYTRPKELATKKGEGGRPIELASNYFKLMSTPDWALYQYRVDIAPEEDRTIVRKALLRRHREVLGGYLFDGTVLFTCSRILAPQEDTRIFTSADKDDESKIFTITVKPAGDVSKGDFAYIQVFNMLMRTCLAGLDLQLVGRDYYDAKAKVEVREHKLELWPGYKTSIRQHESDILMCVEITHKVMRMDTVLDVLQECYNKGGDFKREFVNQIVGCVVLTDYNNKTYRVDDVDFNCSPSNTFSQKGKEVTYAGYMKAKYNINIRDMKQPMLVSKAKARDVRAGMAETIYLIPEVCRMTGLNDGMRANFQLMKALAVHTRVPPAGRIAKLLAFNQRLNSNPETGRDLQRWQMQLDKNLVRLPGRIVEEERIVLGGGRYGAPGPQVDWTRDLRSNPMLHAVALEDWIVLVPGRNKRDAGEFVAILTKAGRGMSFNMRAPQIIEIPDDRPQTYAAQLGQILDKGKPQLIMCVVSNNRGDRYSSIKKKCCVDRAVPTQVILAKNLNSKGVMSIATKVAIQMNCKIGGAPWSVEMPLPELMVVGFDVCHDTTNKQQSYGAMVASLDRAMSRYFSAVSAHRDGQELCNHLALNIIKALHKYKQFNNNSLPKRIIIFRDGVGEGQVPFVHSTELEIIKQKLHEVYVGAGAEPVKLAFIIVTKRINTRIFANQGNPPSGTVVDDVITDPEKYDFFLVSQSVREGTVSPTSYNVIHDTLRLPPGRLQRIAYKLCHMYFNWSGTVRVPAPCQYAHKLAFLVGQSIHREPASGLEDLLYFL